MWLRRGGYVWFLLRRGGFRGALCKEPMRDFPDKGLRVPRVGSPVTAPRKLVFFVDGLIPGRPRTLGERCSFWVPNVCAVKDESSCTLACRSRLAGSLTRTGDFPLLVKPVRSC